MTYLVIKPELNTSRVCTKHVGIGDGLAEEKVLQSIPHLKRCFHNNIIQATVFLFIEVWVIYLYEKV